MKFLFDFFPSLVFFIVYKIWGFFPATYAIIIATAIQVTIFWVRNRRFDRLHVVMFVLILLFGGLTIYFHQPEYLMWKVSIVNWALGAAMLLSQLTKRNLLEHLFNFAAKRSEQEINLPKKVTKRLNIAWALFFIILGFVNIYIAHHYPLTIWVDFKVFGIFGLTIAFVLLQSVYLYKYFKEMEDQSKDQGNKQ